MPLGSSLIFYVVFISPKHGDAHTIRGLMFKNVFSIFFKDRINKDRTNKGPNNIPNHNWESRFTLPSKRRHNIQFLKILYCIIMVLHAEIHLNAKGLCNSIIKGNMTSSQDKAKAMISLRHNLDESRKVEHLTVKELVELWIGLKGRYDHLKAMVLPRAYYEGIHLRFQDYKTVIEYNSIVFRITSQLKLCGKTIKYEDMLKKTLTSFHASNMILIQQYGKIKIRKYS